MEKELLEKLQRAINRVSMPWSDTQIHKDTLAWVLFLFQEMIKKYNQQDFPADWDPITMYEWWYRDCLNAFGDAILKYNETVELARNLNIKKWK